MARSAGLSGRRGDLLRQHLRARPPAHGWLRARAGPARRRVRAIRDLPAVQAAPDPLPGGHGGRRHARHRRPHRLRMLHPAAGRPGRAGGAQRPGHLGRRTAAHGGRRGAVRHQRGRHAGGDDRRRLRRHHPPGAQGAARTLFLPAVFRLRLRHPHPAAAGLRSGRPQSRVVRAHHHRRTHVEHGPADLPLPARKSGAR